RGIYALIDVNSDDRRWEPRVGNLRNTEFYSVAYDPVFGRILGGAQDNGSPIQKRPSEAGYPFTWKEDPVGGGGVVVAVDADQQAHPGSKFLYFGSSDVGGFTRRSGTAGGASHLGDGRVAAGGGGQTLNPNFDNTITFVQPYVLNAVNPARMIIGTSFLYESMDGGNNLTPLGGLMDLNSDGLNNDNDFSDPPANTMPLVDELDEFASVISVVGGITALAYGGMLGDDPAPDVLYVGKNGGAMNGITGTLLLRTTNATNSMADFTTLTNYPGGVPRDIVLDPDNWRRGYLVDSNNQVWRFVNAGASLADWTKITGNLNPPPGSTNPPLSNDLRTIELFTPTAASRDDFVLVGGFGGVFRTLNPGPDALWTEFGARMPNVIVSDLRYTYPITTPGAPFPGDVLLAGTFGRSAWTISNASTSIQATGGVLQINGDTDFAGEDDT